MQLSPSKRRALRRRSEVLLDQLGGARSPTKVARLREELDALAWEGLHEVWQDLFEDAVRRRDLRNAMHDLHMLAENGWVEPSVRCALDLIYEDRFGSPREQRRAGLSPHSGVEILLWLARGGEPGAMYWLSRVYDFGGPVRRSPRKALLWTRRAAAAGDVDSITNLGVRYRQGEGVRRNPRKAVQLYRRAARRGCPSAMANLGRCAWHGEGVRLDQRAAVRWFSKSGNASSKSYLADARIDGIGLRRDPARGWRELRARERAGCTSALYLIADRMGDGRGCPLDRNGARLLLQRARSIERRSAQDFLGL